ncbi:hypothetical protein AMTR_s00141p00016020 [Amborella trichopoda]|uniref:Uncharacterized protein n=1 Tax=Amborella trichopoda TaxID=13333 RepID=W1PG88_AMBTC|nr:hypothetical protein AMTR_s00141p00016020 [Amborella trichopoda]
MAHFLVMLDALTCHLTATTMLLGTFPMEWDYCTMNLVGCNPPLTFDQIEANLEEEELAREA